MARDLNLAQLRKLVEKAEAALEKLHAKRVKILADLAEVEAEIAAIEGGGPGRVRGRKAKGTGRRGRPAKTGAKRGRKPGRRGRPPKAVAASTPPKRRGRPPKSATATGETTPRMPRKRGRKPAAKKESGPTLRDYMIKALEAAGNALSVEDLAVAVEKLGYSSKNTPQLIRMGVPRGPFKKTGDGAIALA